MVKAYILIEVRAGSAGSMVNALLNLPNVEDVTRVTGPYDVIAVVRDEDLSKINDFVVGDIHRLEGVMRTTTCVSLEEQ